MAIDININAAKTTTLATGVQDAGAGEVTSGKVLSAILGGKSLVVTQSLGGDLDAIIEKLKNEQERTKFALLFTSLQSISQSLTDAQKSALEHGLALSEQLEELEKTQKEMQEELDAATKDAVTMQAKIDMLQTQIDLAIQEGKDHNELVQEQNKLRKELDAKKQVVADTQGKINTIANQISEVNGKLSVAISAVGENSMKTIAHEIAGIFDSEKAETSAEKDKRLAKEDEVDPFKPIRHSLDEFRQELLDAIAENTSEIKA